jgi:hypothetical protein
MRRVRSHFRARALTAMTEREVKPRDIPSNPRCADCASDDARGRRPMFHPAHPERRCWVILPGGDQCPCTSERVLQLTEH